MNILDFPPEIFQKILCHSILSQSYDANIGVVRGLRLKLVCRDFYFAVDEALFESKLLDEFMLLCYYSTLTSFAPWLMEKRLVRRFYGADQFWHRYVLYRTTREKDPNIGRFVEMKSIAHIICNETGAEYDKTLDTIAWLALESATNSMTHRTYGMKCSPVRGEFEYWRLNRGNLDFKSNNDLVLAKKAQRQSENLLSVAAHLNLLPLAKRLLSMEGTDPTRHNDLFDAPIMLAAYAGHREMLELLQQSVPVTAEDPADRDRWIAQADKLSIYGVAQRGDINLLLDMADGASFKKTWWTYDGIIDEWDYDAQYLPEFTVFKPSGAGGSAAQWTNDFKAFKDTMISRHKFRKLTYLQALLEPACWMGNLDLVRSCVDNRDEFEWLEEFKMNGDTIKCPPPNDALFIAARASHEDIVDFLLYRGFRPDQHTLAAAAASGSLRMVSKLLDHGVLDKVSHDIESWPCESHDCRTSHIRNQTLDDEQYQAFRHAVRMEHRPMMELLRSRIPLRQADLDEALRDAVSFGLESMALLLWEWGARINPLNFKLKPEDRATGVDLWEKEVARVLSLIEDLETDELGLYLSRLWKEDEEGA